MRKKLVNNFPGSAKAFVGIGASQIEIELIKGSLGHKVGAIAERFQVKELIFDEAVDGFDPSADGL